MVIINGEEKLIKRKQKMVAHVLVFPFPGQGHINCMLKLAELLSLSGLCVSFLNTDYNHRRLRRFSSAYSRLALRPGFRFLSIADGLPDEKLRSAARLWDLDDSLRIHAMGSFRDLLISCKPPVTCAVIDSVLPYAVQVAHESKVPLLVFRTASACSFWAYYCIPKLIQSGELPFPEDGDLDEKVLGVPGMEDFLRRRDLPSFCREAQDSDDRALQMVSRAMAHLDRAPAMIMNTFESLEGSLLSHITSNVCQRTFAIGPLHAMLQNVLSRQGNSEGDISGSLWPEDHTCVAWLDAQPHQSVVYVSFGSYTVMSKEEVLEFWHGLLNSGYRFLWVLRPDLVNGEEMQSLWTTEQGCLVEWAPQIEVLVHPAVGCFFTHSGWNSTLECVVAGVPMICWPFFADQQTNSRFASEVWKIGLDMKDLSGRSIVERMVREAMEGDRAKELKRTAAATAELARLSVEEGGSSYVQFQSLLQYIKCLDESRDLYACFI